MKRLGRGLVGRTVCGIAGLGLVMVMATTPAPAQAPQAPSLAGVWKNGDTTLRVTQNRAEVKGSFVELGQNARALGFKPGEVSFSGTANGNFMNGEQTIRYSVANCHPNGRKVPMMGRLAPNGQALAIHYYFIAADANCRDTGQYNVTETLWERVPGR